MSTFTDEEVTVALEELPGWSVDGDAITKTYEFADFRAALDFMNRAAGPIEEMDHHPEWSNVYNKVEVRLSSHDVGGITDRDARLATVLERVADASS